MPRRKRDYIPMRERLAAALALALPQELRDLYREKKVPAAVILAQFEFDHVALHAQGGSDAWHNLDPLLKPAHREKSRRDTSIVAKGKRIEPAWREFTRTVLAVKKRKRRKSKWPRRRMR